jgi:hypothetical protein
MRPKRTLSSAMLYLGIGLVLAGCGGSERTEQQNLAKVQHETDAILAAVTAKAKESEAPKPDPPPRPKPKPTRLSEHEWEELESRTSATLLIVLGNDDEPRNLAGEEGVWALGHHVEESHSEELCLQEYSVDPPCFKQLGETMASAAAEGRHQADILAQKVQGSCAVALHADAAVWAHLEDLDHVFEQGTYPSADTEWERASVPAERLLIEYRPPDAEPQVELGGELQACRPSSRLREVTVAEHLQMAVRAKRLEEEKIERENQE